MDSRDNTKVLTENNKMLKHAHVRKKEAIIPKARRRITRGLIQIQPKSKFKIVGLK